MKILLTTLNAKYIHSNLAMKYLYAASGEARDTIELREFTINQENDLIYTELMRCESDLIGFSCYIWNIERILELADTIKKASPETKILLGGPEVTYRAEQILNENPSIDMILSGEGEESFPKLLRVLFEEAGEGTKFSEQPDANVISDFEKALGLYGIDGLAFRKEDSIVVNSSSEAVDFENVPFPYLYLPCDPDKIVYYESSRGCPFRCTYCLSSLEKDVRAIPIDRVKQDLRYFLYKGIRQVKFIDRTFNYDKERAAEIFRFLISADNKTTNFHFELCGELLDDEMIDLLAGARPGLFQFEIGVQSTNPETLKAIRRSTDLQKLSSNVKRIRAKNNIHLHLDLIAGLPYEGMETFRKSFNDIYALRPHVLQLGFLKMLPGTPIRKHADEYGYLYRDKAPYEVIANRFLSAKELVRIKMIEAVLDRFYNRGGFLETLEYAAEGLLMSPFDFYEEFAIFYYKKGFQISPQSKENLYRVLAGYGRWKDTDISGTGETMQEVLMKDMQRTLNPEDLKKFIKQGWELE
jgi:radical SAM superfamily enzyme YgiQ (UPF0313 family)